MAVKAGIVISGGSPSITGNSIEGQTNRGVAVGRGSSPTLSGNTICGSEVNLFIADGAEPVIAEDNEICADMPDE